MIFWTVVPTQREKLTAHDMKLSERKIEAKTRGNTCERREFEFIAERRTTDASFALRQIMENYFV